MFRVDPVERPYVVVPSHEPALAAMVEAARDAADRGRPRLLAIHGPPYVGKSRLVRRMTDATRAEGMGYEVLTSRRDANDRLTSFRAFREVVAAALRACDVATRRGDEAEDRPRDGGGSADGGDLADDDESSKPFLDECSELAALRRLVRRKVLSKSDRLMIGRILPDAMDGQLLSLLKGRSPAALTKDVASTLFRIMIPLQPVMLVLESEGDGGEMDPNSWDLVEELLTSAGERCPQMLVVTTSRDPSGGTPLSVARGGGADDNGSGGPRVDVGVGRMTLEDIEGYIRALFCDPGRVDENMSVDPGVARAVHERTGGCPLFVERTVLWSQRKELIELDETRNAVALNLQHHQDHSNSKRNDASMLLDRIPANLNEEILEVINNLPHHLLDALKVAACMGITFNLEDYMELKVEQGLHDSLQQLTASHGIFDYDGTRGAIYRWRQVAVNQAVESIIISNERIEIQGRIADSLGEDVDKGNDGTQYYARHFVMAERWNEAFDQYMEAGGKAEERLDYVGAVGMYREAKECLAKCIRPSLKRRLSPHTALGWCLRELVKYEDAEKELEFCLKETMAVPESERNAQFKEIELDVATTLATLKQAQSKYSEAMEMYERALPIARANRENHSRVWLAHHVASCAEIHRKSGDLEQARGLHTEALGYRELAVEEQSCTSLELALSFTQLGCTLSGLGEHSRAYGLHKKALAARVEYLDFYHGLVSESLNYCADALQALGRGGEGIPLGMHAVKIRKHVFGPLHPAYAHALSVLASCYHSVGRSFDSLGLLKECLEICEKAFSQNHANLIPNLMLYGSVLSVTGNCEKSFDVYNRALAIHKLNFKDGQNAQQLVKLQKAMKELSSQCRLKESIFLEMPIPSFEYDGSKTHVIVCADIGSRASDELMIAVAASLQKMGALKLISVIAVRPPQEVRANIARGALDSLLLSNVPVACSNVASSAPSTGRTPHGATGTFQADYGISSVHLNNTGLQLMERALLQAPDKSLVVLCTSCLGDVSQVINAHRDLFARKVKQLVVIGSVKPKPLTRRNSPIEPEECGDEKCDEFSQNVYRTCQELDIPTVTLSKDVSLGFPFSSAHVDELASSNHMVSTKIAQSEEMYFNGIWELAKQLKQSSKSRRTPKNLDVKSFHKYSLGNKSPNLNQHNVWPCVKSINLELVLGLLCCIPMYQEGYFRWEINKVNGTEHKVFRYSNAATGILKPDALSNEIHMLIGFALRASLLNTSC
ncbi:hypothetical protein ACHAWF_013042 [Thalassiosira exigua]